MVLPEKVYPDEPVVQYGLCAAVSLLSFNRAGELDQSTFGVTLIAYLNKIIPNQMHGPRRTTDKSISQWHTLKF